MTSNQYQDIAREFLDLWQKQMASVMGDKQFIHAMLELFQNMQAKSGNEPDEKPDAPSHTAASDTANASAAEHGVLAELAFRVAMCEKRLTALETGKPAAGKPTARKASPKKSTGTKTVRKKPAKSNTGRGKKPNT